MAPGHGPFIDDEHDKHDDLSIFQWFSIENGLPTGIENSKLRRGTLDIWEGRGKI